MVRDAVAALGGGHDAPQRKRVTVDHTDIDEKDEIVVKAIHFTGDNTSPHDVSGSCDPCEGV